MTAQWNRILSRIALATILCGLAFGCKDKVPDSAQIRMVSLALDWRPEPEFGGFYQAKLDGDFRKRNIPIDLHSAGEGAPIWQLVANGQADFGTTGADEVLIARSKDADVVAIFAVYQTSPQGIMVHQARGLATLEGVFTNSGTLLAEHNPWLTFLLNKYGKPAVTISGDTNGISAFLANPNFSQQCYVTSEPILAEHQGGDPKTFLIADAGFNPYVTVLVTSGKTLRDKPELVKGMVEACREGWRAYLDDPTAANKEMQLINRNMDPKTFTDAAAAQKRLIETDDTRKNGLGTMTLDRWKTLAQQLVDLKVIDKAPPAEECFVNPK